MKIDFLTYATPSLDYYFKYSKQIHKAYCDKHSYTYIIGDQSLLDSSKWITWTKLNVVLDRLKATKADYLFWCDADSVPVNFDVSLEKFISGGEDFIFASEGSEINKLNNNALGDGGTFFDKTTWDINSGNFFVKNSEASVNYLTKLANDKNFAYYWYNSNCYHEESAFLYSMCDDGYKDLAKIKILPSNNVYVKDYNPISFTDENICFYHQCGALSYKGMIKLIFDKLQSKNLV